jgi:hypothetical protein
MRKHWIESALEIANMEFFLTQQMKKNPVPDEGSIEFKRKVSMKHEESIQVNVVLDAEVVYHAHDGREEPQTSPNHAPGKMLIESIESVFCSLPDVNGNPVKVDIKKLLTTDEIIDAIDENVIHAQ